MEEDNFQGKCIILSAPSGAGKTTIVKHLLKQDLNLIFSVSATSRVRRHNEIDGRDYYFLSVDEFKEKIAKGDFLEWQEVYKDNYYGTLKSEITRIWNLKKHVIFDVDVIGGLNLKDAFGDKALAIFVMPPSIDHLEDRLKQRETETAESIERRISKAAKELETAERFDTILLNDSLHNALSESFHLASDFLKKNV